MKKLFLLLTLFISLTASAGDRLPLKGGWNFVFHGKTEVSLTKQYANVSFLDPTVDNRGDNQDSNFDVTTYKKIRIYHDPVDRDINIITTGLTWSNEKNDYVSTDKYPGNLQKGSQNTYTTIALKEGVFKDNIITQIRLQTNEATANLPYTVTINKVVLMDENNNVLKELYYSVNNGDSFAYTGIVDFRDKMWQNMGGEGAWLPGITESEKAYYTFHFNEPIADNSFAIRNNSSDQGGTGYDFKIPGGVTYYQYVATDPAKTKVWFRRQGNVASANIASVTKTLSTEPQSVTINSTGISSFVTDVPLDFTGVDVAVFVVENTDAVKNDAVKLKQVEKVNSGAYFILGEPGTINNISIYTADIESQDNLLKGSTVFTGKSTPGMTRYALSNVDGMLHPVDENVEIPAGKAYLELPTSAGARALTLSFDNSTTGVETFEAATNNNAATFNIAGQRVDSSAKGIVIKNGKKYFNK